MIDLINIKAYCSHAISISHHSVPFW